MREEEEEEDEFQLGGGGKLSKLLPLRLWHHVPTRPCLFSGWCQWWRARRDKERLDSECEEEIHMENGRRQITSLPWLAGCRGAPEERFLECEREERVTSYCEQRQKQSNIPRTRTGPSGNMVSKC